MESSLDTDEVLLWLELMSGCQLVPHDVLSVSHEMHTKPA